MPGLRIATFNLESLDDRPNPIPLAERIATLRPQILRLDADILCLQEVNAQHVPGGHGRSLAALDALLAGTPYADFARAATQSSGGAYPADRHNQVILSRFPIAEQRQLWHTLLPPLRYAPHTALPPAERPAEIRFDRPILYARIAAGDAPLHIVNVHFKAPAAAAIAGQKQSASTWRTMAGWAEGFFLASLKRAGQALETRLLLEQLFDADPQARILVCGDFNAETAEIPVRIVLGAAEDTGNPALAGRAMAVLDDALPPDRRFSVIHAGRRVMLDHILASAALARAPAALQAHNDGLADEALGLFAGGRMTGSFHAPVVAEIGAG